MVRKRLIYVFSSSHPWKKLNVILLTWQILLEWPMNGSALNVFLAQKTKCFPDITT